MGCFSHLTVFRSVTDRRTCAFPLLLMCSVIPFIHVSESELFHFRLVGWVCVNPLMSFYTGQRLLGLLFLI